MVLLMDWLPDWLPLASLYVRHSILLLIAYLPSSFWLKKLAAFMSPNIS